MKVQIAMGRLSLKELKELKKRRGAGRKSRKQGDPTARKETSPSEQRPHKTVGGHVRQRLVKRSKLAALREKSGHVKRGRRKEPKASEEEKEEGRRASESGSGGGDDDITIGVTTDNPVVAGYSDENKAWLTPVAKGRGQTDLLASGSDGTFKIVLLWTVDCSKQCCYGP